MGWTFVRLRCFVSLVEYPFGRRGTPLLAELLPCSLYPLRGTEMADRFRGPRMAKHWHVIPGVSISLTGDATFAGGGLSLDGPFTVVRMLGEYIVSSDEVAPVANDEADVCCAIGVVSSDAFAVGASAMPDPVAEPDYPWLFWASHPMFFPNSSLEGSGASRSVRRSFDIRSMRKMKPRETLAMVIQYADTAGVPPLQFAAAQTRVLVAT